MSSLDGFKIVVSELLTGGKRAVRQGDTIAVSPAMFALAQGATSDELARLWQAIEVLDLGAAPCFDQIPFGFAPGPPLPP